MIKVKRANVVLTVDDDKKDYYLAKGFNIYSQDGELLEEAIPVDIGVLQKAYVMQKAKIKALEAEIASLKDKPVVEKTTKKRKTSED